MKTMLLLLFAVLFPADGTKKRLRSAIFRKLVFLLPAGIMLACANIGNPNGGPYDEDPPKYVNSKPNMNQLNFNGKKIEIWFDEFISIDNPNENVIITPPQMQNPIIQAVGKKIKIELRDTLLEETTYTVDFTSSIVDNNEKTPLENFSYAFSTGSVLDTLQISGTLINAENLEPVQKMLVGIHQNLSDTAFTKTKLLRTSKTDDRGRFSIKNVTPGSYRVFALEDKNRNYAYDKNSDEGLAFLDSIIVPSCERALVADTIRKDSITIDTIMMVERTLFYPNDLVLWFFTDSVAPRQRMLKPERTKEHIITLKFNAPMDTFPKPVPLNFEPADSIWYVTQRGEGSENFAINYWILDSMIYKIDTLHIEVSYWKNNDSIPELLEVQTDTLKIPYREAQTGKKETKPKKPVQVRRPAADTSRDTVQKEPETVPAIPLQLNIAPAGSLNPYDIITVMMNEPVLDVRKEHFVMEIGVDTLWEAVDFEFEVDSIRAMSYILKRPFKYEERYRVLVDSAVFTSVYGRSNNKASVQMTVKERKDYGQLKITVQGLPLTGDSSRVTPAFMELLNNGGAPIRKVIVENGVADFTDITAEKYYVRLILDANGNDRWDAGNYEEKRQPESVYYFMEQIVVRQNWEDVKDWDISTSVPGQKPVDLIKNKPKEETKQKRDYREESKPKKGNSSMPSVGGLRF